MAALHFKVHVAIDFGTDATALAFSMGGSDQKVIVYNDWKSRKYEVGEKQKTIILLDKNEELIMYGLDAKHMYLQAEKFRDKWLLFERFKMSLYDDKSSYDDEQRNIKMSIKQELTAANGKKVKSSVVFIAAFKYLQKLAKQWMKRKRIKGIKDKDIQWIITVPAIWNDAAKLQMRQWTIDAGLVDEDIKEQCKIVYEPDCASLAIQYHISNFIQDIEIENDANYHGAALKKGDRYILVDAGGGTVDVSCHEILGEYGEFGVREVLNPSGGPWGGCYIDDKFVDLLKDIFSNEWIEEFKSEKPNIYIESIDNFQRVKATFYTNSEDEEYTVRLPFEFIGFMQDKLEDEQEVEDDVDIDTFVAEANVFGESNLVSLTDEYLSIAIAGWKKLFDTVINPIIGHIQKLLEEPKLKINCKYLCLVGGLSTSPYFQAKLKETFGQKSKYKLSLIIPQKPILSVVEGAAYVGITDNFINSTISRYCNNKTPISISVDDMKEREAVECFGDEMYGSKIASCCHGIDKEIETSDEDMHDIVDVDVIEAVEQRLKEEMERWILAYSQSMKLKHHNHNAFQPLCNHLNECDQCSKLKNIEVIRRMHHSLQQQQEYHSSFIQTIDKMLQNATNGEKCKVDPFFRSSDSHHSSLPTSSRDEFQIQHQMDQIRDFLKLPANIEQILKRSKWDKIQVFDKKQIEQRMTLYITHQDLNEKIRGYISYHAPTIIPIIMFGIKKNWIEYIVVIDSYSFGSIGVSLSYDKEGHLNISNLYLDWTAIRRKHEMAMPIHMKKCRCFDGINPVIDDIHVGNPDDVENKMKSYQTQCEILHKVQEYAYQYIDSLAKNNNDNGS